MDENLVTMDRNVVLREESEWNAVACGGNDSSKGFYEAIAVFESKAIAEEWAYENGYKQLDPQNWEALTNEGLGGVYKYLEIVRCGTWGLEE